MINFIKWLYCAPDNEELPTWVRVLAGIIFLSLFIFVGAFTLLSIMIAIKTIGFWLVPVSMMIGFVVLVIVYKSRQPTTKKENRK